MAFPLTPEYMKLNGHFVVGSFMTTSLQISCRLAVKNCENRSIFDKVVTKVGGVLFDSRVYRLNATVFFTLD